MEPHRTFPSFLKKIFKQQSTVSSIQAEVYQEIDSLLEMDNLEGLSVFVNNDIKFSKSHIDTILFKDPKGLVHSMADDVRGKFMTKNKDLIAQVIADRIVEGVDYMAKNNFYGKKYYTVDIKEKSRKELIKFQKAYNLFATPFGQYVFKKEDDSIYRVYAASLSVRKSFTRMHEKYKSSSFESVTTHFRESVQKNLTDKITLLYNDANNERLKKLAQRANQLEMSEVKQSMIESATHSINSFKLDSLPVNSQNLIHEINTISQNIKEVLGSMNIDSQLQFENLNAKRLAQVIQEYIVIPDKDTGGKNSPNHLLEDSLGEIKEKMSAILHSHTDSHLNSMKKTNKYLKSI